MRTMARGKIVVALLVLALMLVSIPAAFAKDPCSDSGNGNGEGNGRPCEQVPESSHALYYAGAGIAVVVGFAAFETRRRRRHADALR
jgi:hypothetical protein